METIQWWLLCPSPFSSFPLSPSFLSPFLSSPLHCLDFSTEPTQGWKNASDSKVLATLTWEPDSHPQKPCKENLAWQWLLAISKLRRQRKGEPQAGWLAAHLAKSVSSSPVRDYLQTQDGQLLRSNNLWPPHIYAENCMGTLSPTDTCTREYIYMYTY